MNRVYFESLKKGEFFRIRANGKVIYQKVDPNYGQAVTGDLVGLVTWSETRVIPVNAEIIEKGNK